MAAVLALGLLAGTAAHAQSEGDSSSQRATPPARLPDVFPKVPVTNQERAAWAVRSLDLDLHLVPAEARLEGHALLVVRNVSQAPLTRLPLQLSSSLRWSGLAVAGGAGLRAAVFTQSPVATDADHTAYAQEAVVTLAEPLAPGGELTLSAVYDGEIRRSAARLELLNAPAERAQEAEWDEIRPTGDEGSTALRGFGDVLWYPVAAPCAALGDGNRLFAVVAAERAAGLERTFRLRLTIEYRGDPPEAAIVNGTLVPLAHTPDATDQSVDETVGLATAEMPAAPLGYRVPSLFLTAQHAATGDDRVLSVVSAAPVAEPYRAAAGQVAELVGMWLGPVPARPLLLLDHAGEPFEDGAFLAAQLSARADAAQVAPALVRVLTHAWWRPADRQVARPAVWLEQGVPEFMSLLWTERTQGREAALARLQHDALLLALAEPAGDAETGQPLTEASSDVYLRLKSAAVLWQLRELAGDDVLRAALTAYRRELAAQADFERDPHAFERVLERAASAAAVTSKEVEGSSSSTVADGDTRAAAPAQDLHTRTDFAWFFNDWVYADRGLPDLTLVQANPRALPARPGRPSGYLVSVEVRNDGGAAVEVPVTVAAGALTSTERLRVPVHSTNSTRVLFEGTPETVTVNNGSTPEQRANLHVLTIHMEP